LEAQPQPGCGSAATRLRLVCTGLPKSINPITFIPSLRPHVSTIFSCGSLRRTIGGSTTSSPLARVPCLHVNPPPRRRRHLTARDPFRPMDRPPSLGICWFWLELESTPTMTMTSATIALCQCRLARLLLLVLASPDGSDECPLTKDALEPVSQINYPKPCLHFPTFTEPREVQPRFNYILKTGLGAWHH